MAYTYATGLSHYCLFFPLRGYLPFQSSEPRFVSVCRAPPTGEVVCFVYVACGDDCLTYARVCLVRACVHTYMRVPFTVSQCIRASDTIIVASAFNRSQTATVTFKHDSDAGVLPYTVGKISFTVFHPINTGYPYRFDTS